MALSGENSKGTIFFPKHKSKNYVQEGNNQLLEALMLTSNSTYWGNQIHKKYIGIHYFALCRFLFLAKVKSVCFTGLIRKSQWVFTCLFFL